MRLGSNQSEIMSEEGYVLVTIVGVHGIWCEFPMLSSSTFWDLKYLIKEVLHVQKRDQKLFLGFHEVDLRWSLGATMSCERQCCVTLVREPARCEHCGARAGRLKRCSGCNDAYYCSAACQKTDWQRHRCTGPNSC